MHTGASLIHALPIEGRRVFTRAEAASYVGVSPGHFTKLVEEGRMPMALRSYGRVCRWDKVALDRVLDGEDASLRTGSLSADGAYDAWRRQRG